MNKALRHDLLATPIQTDVLVVGGGSAGCCAAIAAAAGGAKVVLVERYGFLGGSSTGVLDTFYGFFTPGQTPRKVVGGIPDRVVDALADVGAMHLRPNTYGAGAGVTYNPERLKLVWDQLLSAAGVRVLLHSFVIDAQTDSAGRIIAAIIATKRGISRIAAQRFIDASGDADLCHWAGIAYETAGEIDPAQTLTTTFRMANVDETRFEAAGGAKMMTDRMAEAVRRGTHALPRKKGSFHAMTIPGCVATVAVRVADVDGCDPEQLTKAEMEGRRQAFLHEQFVCDCVPGYEEASIVGLSTQIGVRETRRVYGEYRLSCDDCMSGRRFDDVVLLCGAPIEDHRRNSTGDEETAWAYVPGGAAYDVPYRTLVPRGRDEIWVAGRCFSATHDAHASCRSMAQTMSMGQAAGAAAVLSLDRDCGARDVPVARLQERLRALGCVLETPDAEADTSRNGWSVNGHGS